MDAPSCILCSLHESTMRIAHGLRPSCFSSPSHLRLLQSKLTCASQSSSVPRVCELEGHVLLWGEQKSAFTFGRSSTPIYSITIHSSEDRIRCIFARIYANWRGSLW